MDGRPGGRAIRKETHEMESLYRVAVAHSHSEICVDRERIRHLVTGITVRESYSLASMAKCVTYDSERVGPT